MIIFKDFQDITNPHSLSVDQLLDRIRTGRSKKTIDIIREKVAAGEKADEEKKSLPCILFSADQVEMVINRNDNESFRDDRSVTKHSGFFTLDFDKCNVQLKLDQLRKDPYIFAAWVSPSGTGVRALVKCPPSIENHSLYYTAFLDRYPELDSTSRNISRITFESYDPNIYVNRNSLVWDKKLTEEERRKNKEKSVNRRANRILSTAAAMVRSSYDGVKHESLLKAANLLGGYIASGRVNEDEAIALLESEIKQKGPSDMALAKKTILDGINYGKSRPLAESKKIEKAQQYLRRENGDYDFLADDEEMDEYLHAVINGTLEQGLPTGLNDLNTHWMFKKHHLVWIAALDNVGKSFFVWYLAVLAAKFHGWRILINSGENGDGQLRKKLMEFYLGKSVKLMDDSEIYEARQFVKDHFRIISSKQLHTLEDFLLKCELVFDEGWEFDVVIGEPFNSFDVPVDANMHMMNLKSLNQLRVFKENYSSVWITDHIGTAAARKKDKDGYIEVPWKSDVDYGQLKANKADDFLILHRLLNHEFEYNRLQIHVTKVKDVETGGKPTNKDAPVIIEINNDYCGYHCNYIDPIKHVRI